MASAKGYTIEEQGRLNNFAVEPKMYVDSSVQPGFTQYAEKLNGRLAMLGFVSLLALEAVTGHGIVGWLTSL
jgi:hypothetical protein